MIQTGGRTNRRPPCLTMDCYAQIVLLLVAARLGLYPGASGTSSGDSLLSHPYQVAMGVTALGRRAF